MSPRPPGPRQYRAHSGSACFTSRVSSGSTARFASSPGCVVSSTSAAWSSVQSRRPGCAARSGCAPYPATGTTSTMSSDGTAQRASMRLDPREFRARPLRAHALLHDVPLEDAWAVPLAGGGTGRTIEDVRAVMTAGRATAPALVRALFWLRFRIGALLAWDQPRPTWSADTFADRLSDADRARSLVTPGTPDGPFRLLYRFDDEQLAELRNSTVHAFASLSIRPAPQGYVAYLGVFVRPVSRFTGLYMAAIAPFRRLIVYPALIRTMQKAWAERFSA